MGLALGRRGRAVFSRFLDPAGCTVHRLGPAPEEKKFGTKSQATEDSLGLPKVRGVRELFGNAVAWTSVWAVSSTEHSGIGAIIWIMPMSFAYFSFNLLMAYVLYCFSDPLRVTTHDCISENGCLWLIPWWLQNPSSKHNTRCGSSKCFILVCSSICFWQKAREWPESLRFSESWWEGRRMLVCGGFQSGGVDAAPVQTPHEWWAHVLGLCAGKGSEGLLGWFQALLCSLLVFHRSWSWKEGRRLCW